MSLITFVERDLTPAEREQVDAGFAAYGLEHGNLPHAKEVIGLVALDGERLAGCAFGRTSDSRRWFYLSDLYVEKPYRGQRLGEQLLAAIEAMAATIGGERIWVWTAGFEAPGFYQKHGYTIFVEMPGWYTNGHSRFGLWKNLPYSPSSSGTVDGGS